MVKVSTKDKSFDLEERLAVFAENTVLFVKKLPISPINRRPIDQLIGSSGSSGANYCEANESESKKDFIHKIQLTKKELRESQHWFRILAAIHPEHVQEIRMLWKEAHELLLIFSKIVTTSKKSD